MVEWLEYAAAWLALKSLGLLPRLLARAVGAQVLAVVYFFRPTLRRTALFNLRLAFPDWSEAQRRRTMRGLVRHLGWMAGEFSQFPKYTRENVERVVLLDGFENFAAAERRGKGVIFLTGHMGAWELGPFAHALYGHPLHFLVRPIDNARLDALVSSYRCLSGNRPIEKNQSARATLSILSRGGTVGILLDQNTTLEEGIFVDFFGAPACTSTGLARLALHTDGAVVPAYICWDAKLRKYRLRFEPAVELFRSGDRERDIRENTARFTCVIEEYARCHPDQWLWVHRRWQTRPPGEKPLYPF
ncbi:MAG TPA: lysophospholipid acyltransferase family protein [Candidatus Acidoferrales bacterium]|nr:lysophospholipid acyltransferase family protein [Candidatus Acidoferrales bacterium]